MARVMVDIEEVELTNEAGRIVAGVCARCQECDEETESFGTSSASVRRCLALLKENCPNDANNFYVASDGSDKDD